MKVVILAGGFGSRLSEKTLERPKPMIEIGDLPILCHIMNIYSYYGLNEFIIALGYKGNFIKEYFLNFATHNNDLTIDLGTGEKTVHTKREPPWMIHLVETGLNTQTGGRVKKLKNWIGNETFCMTYGDGLSDVNIKELIAFHKAHKKLATITAVRPPARFGGLTFQQNQVKNFSEKPQIGEGWVNGGFFVLEPQVLDYIEGDAMPFEKAPLEKLAQDEQLIAYKHEGFWQPMDTLREYNQLEELYQSGKAPWIKTTPKNEVSELLKYAKLLAK